MRRATAALALALSVALYGNSRAGIDVAPDLSGVTAQIQAETARATAAEGAIPQPCAAPLPPDTLLGTVGAGTPCAVRADAARPTVVQAANVVTDGSGNWAVTWAKPFASATPVVNPLPVNTGTLPIMCNVQGRTATSASGKCWQANTNTLPGTLSALAGLVLNVFATGAANAAVMVIAREPTQ